MSITIQPLTADEPIPSDEDFTEGAIEHYFHFIKNDTKAGYLCVQDFAKDYGDGVCNVYLRILPEYRGKVFNRNSLTFIINFPFTLGFQEVWTNTKWKSWARILTKFGFKEFFSDNGVMWFRKVG